MTAPRDGSLARLDGLGPILEEVLHAVGSVGSTLGDLVPPRARTHLLRAQRELILAVVTTVEHHAGSGPRRRPAPAKRGRGRAGSDGSGDSGAGDAQLRTARGQRRPRHVAVD